MKLKKILTGFVAAAVVATSAVPFTQDYSVFLGSGFTVEAAESSVKFTEQAGFGEGMYAVWSPVSGAEGYNVYVDGAQIDSMLIRQYPGYYRADAVGLKAGSHKMKVVPVIGGKEDNSKAAEASASAYAHDRSGFGFVGGTSSGAYNDDGTLKSNAAVIYVTDATKDTVKVTMPDKKGNSTELTGIQNIILNLKSNKKAGPVDIRVLGNITDPANMPKGDLMVDTVTCGLTIEGIGNDATFNGFGLVMKNSSNVEVRNIGYMNCNSSEGDDCGLQQGNDHVWVHNCDFFYGDAGSDADQVKGDGALDTKTSTYVTHSYNHFWDNGKCNLQGMKSESTENYITYHHNWYDHSDSRHPRIRTCTVHIYNNYYDGNAKYGAGVTMGASAFVENNYFRNCKYPMLASMQGSDIASSDDGKGTFSGEDGGIIKSYGNFMTGQKAYVTYQQNKTEFDAYEASSRDEKVPDTVKTKQGGTAYNNFDTAGTMYKYTAETPEAAKASVTAKAGRVGGGDLKWTFDNATEDANYTVIAGLKSKLTGYKGTLVAAGSGFKKDAEDQPVVTEPVQTTAVTTESKVTTKTTAAVTTKQTQASVVTSIVVEPVVQGAIFASPNGSASGSGSKDSPVDVLTALSRVTNGGYIYLLGGTYKFSEPIVIDRNNGGSAGAYKTIEAYQGEKVYWDFSGEAVSNSNRGVVLDGSYWHFKNFEIANAGDNGMLLSGNGNKIELMQFTNNQDTGLQISRYRTDAAKIADWPTDNLILNCTSKNNCDDATMENADGFAAKLTCGEGNVFDGCISYNNSDDGWDLYAKAETGPTGVVTIRNCVAFRNGFTEYGEGFGNCDGNGFKLGGGGVGTRHVVENCLAFENLNCGFTDNNNPLFGDMKNCTAYNNGVGGNGKANYMVYRCSADADISNLISYFSQNRIKTSFPNESREAFKTANDKFKGKLSNSVYYNSKYYYLSGSTATEGKSIKEGTVITPADDMFITLDVAPYTIVAAGADSSFDFHHQWRNADGSVNTHGFAQVKGGNTYEALGAKFTDSGSTLPDNPVVTTQETTAVVTTTTTVSTTVVTETSKEETSTQEETTAATTASSEVVTTEETTAEATTAVSTEETTAETTTAVSTEATEATSAATLPIDKPGLPGDVDGNGEVGIADVVLLSKYLASPAKFPLPNEAAMTNADVNSSKTVDGLDLSMIIEFVLGTIKEF